MKKDQYKAFPLKRKFKNHLYNYLSITTISKTSNINQSLPLLIDQLMLIIRFNHQMKSKTFNTFLRLKIKIRKVELKFII